MSYILDALRRAESEREREALPTLHSQPAVADLADDEAGGAGLKPWLWGGAALALVGLGALAAQWLGREDKPAVVIGAVAPPPQSSPATPAMLPPVAPPPAVVRAPVPQVQAQVQAQVKAPAPAAVPVPVPPAAERPIPTAAELPESLRRELPALAVGGAMYSDTPANRMLILNGQVFHEGDKVTEQLVLEKIQLRGAVLAFRGQRYTISF